MNILDAIQHRITVNDIVIDSLPAYRLFDQSSGLPGNRYHNNRKEWMSQANRLFSLINPNTSQSLASMSKRRRNRLRQYQERTGEWVLNLCKRHAFVLAGITLYALSSYYPLVGSAESLATNTAQPASTSSQQVQVVDENATPVQYYMLEEATVDTPNHNDSLMEDAAFLPFIPSPDSYKIVRPNDDEVAITVEKEDESGFASILINDQEVMKFRTGVDNLDAYDRAQIVAQRLYNYLNEAYLSEVSKPLSIRPEVANQQTVIKIGNEVLATIDTQTAVASKNTEKQLANIWTNRIRGALGMPKLDAPQEIPIIASKGISKKFKLPLSTAYFSSTGKVQSGSASWYGPGFHGRRSSDGSRFDMNQMTAAHRYLPFGTVVKVKNHRTGKSCVVQITDRGPFAHGRIIDLSKAAASEIGMLGSGTAHVTLEVLAPKKTQPLTPKPAEDIASSN